MSEVIAALKDIASRLPEPRGNVEIPWTPMSYKISTMHRMTVSLAGGGTGLGSMQGRQLAISMLIDAGFEDVEVREIETDPSTDYYIGFPRTAK